MKPIGLGPNQLHRFYRGGEAIARFRDLPFTDDYAPEDWVGSTTTTYGERSAGLSSLPDGRLLRDAMAAEPEAWLGPTHAKRFGADTAILVKLLDAGERLPVHLHPDRAFAQKHLGSPYGKTEAWVILEARGESPSVRLGFREEVEADKLVEWVERQERERLLGALHELAVRPGDWVFVPAGLPHAIGEGVFLVELQEPSDLSVLLEWEGFALDGARDGHLGLGFDVALESVRLAALDHDELDGLYGSTRASSEVAPGVRRLLPPKADAFFRADVVSPHPSSPLEQAFSILVVLEGRGVVRTERGGVLEVRRGQTVLVPFASGEGELAGEIRAIRCLPPLPDWS